MTPRRILAIVAAVALLAACDPDIRIGTPATTTPRTETHR